MEINGRKIGDAFSPYVIAEMSANHNKDIENAFRIIKMAKLSGADCVKLQTYTPDTITLDSKLPDFQLNDGLWAGQSLYSLYDSAYTPWDWHELSKNKMCSWLEVECLGACVSAPMMQINNDYYEDLDEKSAKKVIESLVIDKPLKPGSYRGRRNTSPEKNKNLNGDKYA